MQNSYCLGESGKDTNSNLPPPLGLNKVEKDAIKTDTSNIKEEKEESDASGTSSSSDDAESKCKVDSKKNRKTKKKEKRKKRKGKRIKKLKVKEDNEKWENIKTEEYLNTDERKRPYNSMYEVKQPTEKEMEEYFKKRRRDEDPMNQFL